ncbi:PrgI family protein [Enterococcus sp. AZ012]|uniref:PrgI family protein n=1 Tax=unclassified Enterococcus TaxID=2608891 RepID=UPI003D29D838
MAVEVRVPKDIKEYKEKIIAGMSMKQLFSVGIAIGVNSFISILFIKLLGYSMDTVSWIMIICSIPIVAFGWFKKDGLNFKQFIYYFFLYHLSPGKRYKK